MDRDDAVIEKLKIVTILIFTMCLTTCNDSDEAKLAAASYSSATVIFGTSPADETSAAEARFNYPEDVIEAPDGSIYITDTQSHVIKRLRAGRVAVVAGIFRPGYNGDGTGKDVALNLPTGMLMELDGNALLFADTGNNIIRRLDLTTYDITTVGGQAGNINMPVVGQPFASNSIGYVVSLKRDSAGKLWFAANTGDIYSKRSNLFCVNTAGLIQEADLSASPVSISNIRDFDVQNDYLDFTQNQDFVRLYKSGDSAMSKLSIGYGKGILPYKNGTIVGNHTKISLANKSLQLFDIQTAQIRFANISNLKQAIGRVLIVDSDQGAVFNLVDVDVDSLVVNQLTGSEPTVNGAVVGVAEYSATELLILDNQRSRIYLYNKETGTTRLWAGNGRQALASINVDKLATSFYYPNAIAINTRTKDVFVVEQHRIMRIAANGQVSRYAGYEHNGDLDAVNPTEARFKSISGIAVDGQDALIISDTYNNKIRKIDATGRVVTIAGTGAIGLPSFGIAATKSALNRPHAVLPMPDGSILIADSWNNTVVRLGSDGILRQFAGVPVLTVYQGEGSFGGDKGPAVSAYLNTPNALAFSADGTVYITDQFNHRIRAVSPSGRITTFAGEIQGFAPQGLLLNFPFGLAMSNGNLYVADTGNRIVVRYTIPLKQII